MLSNSVMRATRFEELDVWQLGRQLRQEVYRLCANEQVAKQFDLRDQFGVVCGIDLRECG